MITPVLSTRLQTLAAANSTTQTLKDQVVLPLYATIGSITASQTVQSLAIALGSSSPAAGKLGTNATPQAPSATVYLNADPYNGAGTPLTVEYVPIGELLAAY